eukprot:gene14483-17087_t
MEEIGIDAQMHLFNSSFGRQGVNVVGVNRAVRSLGTECFVLTTAFDQWHSEGAVGFLLAFLEYIKDTHWQARDVMFVFTSEGGEMSGGTSMDISGVAVWLHDYHASPLRPTGWRQRESTNYEIGQVAGGERMIRAGQIYGCLALDRVGGDMDKILVYPEGLEGALSNLDIVNVITTTSFLSDIPAGINTHLPYEEVKGSLYGLFVFLFNSALSMPRSNHAIFTRYGINSVGISTDSTHNAWDLDFLNTPLHKVHRENTDFGPLNNMTILHLGQILETSLRHLHNADEKLHQVNIYFNSN